MASNVVIIPGLVRAGTSQVAKAIHEAGIPMGGGWLEERHYEDCYVTCLNKGECRFNGPKVFAKDGSARIPFEYEPSKYFIEKLMAYKKEREDQHGDAYGFKEPGAADCITAYMRVWPEAKWVVVVRDSVSIGRSQWRRDMSQSDDVNALLHYNIYGANLSWWLEKSPVQWHVFSHANCCCEEGLKDEERALSEFLGLELNIEWQHNLQGVVLPEEKPKPENKI